MAVRHGARALVRRGSGPYEWFPHTAGTVHEVPLTHPDFAWFAELGLRGYSITGHHAEARRFLIHVEREHAAGRPVPVDWSWIVPRVPWHHR